MSVSGLCPLCACRWRVFVESRTGCMNPLFDVEFQEKQKNIYMSMLKRTWVCVQIFFLSILNVRLPILSFER